jgi:hypothetical protein
MIKITGTEGKKQVWRAKALELEERCAQMLMPLLKQLNEKLDVRLVKTLLDLVLLIVLYRERHQGLILSELGGQLLGAAHAPAGSKRIGNLLRSKRWQAAAIENYLWAMGDERVNELMASDRDALVIWDGSEIEKPESLKAEGLCPVRSSKARRLKRIKPGFFNPPGGRPICVPGIHWLQLLVTGLEGGLTLTHLGWWTTRGERATDRRSVEQRVLHKVAQMWSGAVVHVFDQGFSGSPWVTALLAERVRFILRWRKDYKLIGPGGEAKKAWQWFRGQRARDHKQIWDARRRCWRKVGILFTPVCLPDHSRLLWLVTTRPGPGQKPWYLLTSDPVTSTQDAWRIVFAYARRWRVEMALRFEKSELGFEAPRLHTWEARCKFMLIASLAFAFLLSLLRDTIEPWMAALLDIWCHRNGKWSRETPTPLYRLRLALSRLWATFRPAYLPLLNSG